MALRKEKRVDRETLRLIAEFLEQERHTHRGPVIERDFFVLDPKRRPLRLRNDRK